ncbi:MAG: histidine kinase, partial [Bacteroidota bacterium]
VYRFFEAARRIGGKTHQKRISFAAIICKLRPMQRTSFRTYIILSQSGLWLVFFMIHFLAEMSYSGIGFSLLYGLSITLCHILPVYLHYYLILPLLKKRKQWQYWGSSILLLLLASLLLQLVERSLPYSSEFDSPFFSGFIYNSLLLMLVIAVSSLYYFVDAWIANFQTQSMLRTEKLHAELNFLKSQINPHFLFNTLNNIYSYVQTNNEKAAPMLERLSSILRFMVYDGREDLVMLSKELSTTEDLIEIHRMKNPTYRNIHWDIEGMKGFHLIPPLLIVNIVENACKHSDATTNPKGYIDIRAEVKAGDLLLFSVSNSTKEKHLADPNYAGIGLENLRRRLNLLFPNKHQLAEQKEENHYRLELEIPLTRKS